MRTILSDLSNSVRSFSVTCPLFFVCLLCVMSTNAWAVPIDLGDDNKLDLAGTHRIFFQYITPFKLDEEGTSIGESKMGKIHHRLRFSPSLSLGSDWKFFAQIDVLVYDSLYGFDSKIGKGLAAQFSSPIRDQAEGFRPVDPRKLWVSWRSPIGVVRFGQMSSHWGLGMIANDGETQTGEFSAPRFGDIVERLILVTPLLRMFSHDPVFNRLLFAAGLDIVFRDENADLLKGDFAMQGAFSLFYREKDRVFVGVYLAVRSQQDRGLGPTLDVRVLDFFMRLRGTVADGGIQLEVATEAAWLSGSTTRIKTDAAPFGIELSASAIVARLGARLPKAGLRFGVEIGFASGDNDPSDETSRLFRFDPDYQPSLILFRHILSAVSAHGADRAIDPERVGYPPSGSDQIASFGRVGNTLYVQPVIAWQPFFSASKALRKFVLKVGLMYARAVAELADPYNTFRAGGVNTTHFRQPASGRLDLGYELNVSLRYQLQFTPSFAVNMLVLYGHFFPGTAFDEGEGKTTPIDLFQARFVTSF